MHIDEGWRVLIGAVFGIGGPFFLFFLTAAGAGFRGPSKSGS
jgi:hypothetical protein